MFFKRPEKHDRGTTTKLVVLDGAHDLVAEATQKSDAVREEFREAVIACGRTLVSLREQFRTLNTLSAEARACDARLQNLYRVFGDAPFFPLAELDEKHGLYPSRMESPCWGYSPEAVEFMLDKLAGYLVGTPRGWVDGR